MDSHNNSYFTMASHFQTLDPQLIDKLKEKDNWLAQLLNKMHQEEKLTGKKRSVPSLYGKQELPQNKSLYAAKVKLPRLSADKTKIGRSVSGKKIVIDQDNARQKRIYELYGLGKKNKKIRFLHQTAQSKSPPKESLTKDRSYNRLNVTQTAFTQNIEQYLKQIEKIMLKEIEPTQINKSQLIVKQIKKKYNHLKNFNKQYYSQLNMSDLKLI